MAPLFFLMSNLVVTDSFSLQWPSLFTLNSSFRVCIYSLLKLPRYAVLSKWIRRIKVSWSGDHDFNIPEHSLSLSSIQRMWVLDTAYRSLSLCGFLWSACTDMPYLLWWIRRIGCRNNSFFIFSFKLQNARLLVILHQLLHIYCK